MATNRTPEDLELAIRHLSEVAFQADIDNHPDTASKARLTIDVLRWVRGEDTRFTNFMNRCDDVDKPQRRRQ